MRNLKKLVLLGTLAVVGFTGCETSHHRTGDRTEGRLVDDHLITSRVKSELNREPVYKFDDIDVKTFNGVVQLSGFVTTEDQKRKAAEIAQHVDGVIEVQNAISLKPQVPTPTGRYNDGRINDNRINDPNAPAPRR
jgi:hyperosmotically inducible protein